MKFHSATEHQSKLSKMHCIVCYGAHEHETHSGLHFEVKQIQFAPEFHHIISRKKSFAADTKYELKIFMKNWDQRSKSR